MDKNTHTGNTYYSILVVFLGQIWLHEHASMLSHTLFAFIVNTSLPYTYCLYFLQYFKYCKFKHFYVSICETILYIIWIECISSAASTDNKKSTGEITCFENEEESGFNEMRRMWSELCCISTRIMRRISWKN